MGAIQRLPVIGLPVIGGTSQDFLQVDASGNLAQNSLAWTNYSFTSTDFTASAGTWTVTSGEVLSLAYLIMGKTMIISFDLLGTSVSTTPVSLSFLIPASKVANRTIFSPNFIARDNGTAKQIYADVGGSGTTVNFYTTIQALYGGAGNWAASTTNTDLVGLIIFEIQ